MSWGKMVLGAISAATMAATAVAKGPADDIAALTPDTALVIMKSETWQPAPSMKSAYRLTLSIYDPADEKLLGKPFGGSAEFAAQDKKFIDGYLVVRVKPGRWVFQSYSQQDKWALCFNAASSQFDVKPGQIVYLGEFDALRHRQQLTITAIRSGKSSISGYGFADFFDLAEGPAFKPIDQQQLDAVRAMLARTAPAVTAPVVAATYSPAKFGTGSTLFAERRCGGYFMTGAKPKPATK